MQTRLDLKPVDPEGEGLASVEATVAYQKPMAEKPFSLTYPGMDSQPQTNTADEEHRLPIWDARPIADELSVDRQGFALVRRPSSVTDFYDEGQLQSVYHGEAADIVAKATGAARVVAFDHTMRSAAPGRTPSGASAVALRIHGDYTTTSGPQRVRDLMGDEADGLLRRRFAFINVWRPIRGPVLDAPLAVCDARSTVFQDFVAHDLIYPDRKGEIFSVTYNPAHRWFYFPQMRTDEVLLIKCYDSSPDVARFVPHVAFRDPTSPPDAPPRESIEVRTVAFFD